MPIYEYTCKSCDTRFEELQRAAEARAKCPSCGSSKTARIHSVFAVGAAAAKSSFTPASTRTSAPACGRCGSHNPCSME